MVSLLSSTACLGRRGISARERRNGNDDDGVFGVSLSPLIWTTERLCCRKLVLLRFTFHVVCKHAKAGQSRLQERIEVLEKLIAERDEIEACSASDSRKMGDLRLSMKLLANFSITLLRIQEKMMCIQTPCTLL